MSLEAEFAALWATFHENMDRAQVLLGLYPDETLQKVFKENEEATADLNEEFVRMLQIKDKRILRIFLEWRNTDKTGPMADVIFEKRIGGPMVSSLTYTFWKYADVVRI